LAFLTALVLVGRADHVADILAGAQRQGAGMTPPLKTRLKAQLFPEQDNLIWHRDALLFEIICWIVEIDSSPK
jgi:hypothetical protein